jgi:KDO2-lipid IV(A) lauroyltransferase
VRFKRLTLPILYASLEVISTVFLALIRLLPPALFRFVAAPALKLVVLILVPKRRILRSLTAAFGETYSNATKNGLARGVQDHFARNFLHCFLQVRDPEAVRAIRITGLEHLEAARARGRGVVALGAHIGNFALVGARLGIEGYPFNTLFRVPAEPRIEKIIQRHTDKFFQRVIPSRPRRPAVIRILQALKNNEIVFILADNLKKGPIETRLFGQRVNSPRGPASLALRAGAPVVPMHLIRNYNGELELIIEPELELVRNGDLADDIGVNTARIITYIEGLIRRYPDQWNWLTVRWGHPDQGYMYSIGGDSKSATTSVTPGTSRTNRTIVSASSD